MPALANIVINDSVPVAKTFKPAKAVDGLALWEEKTSPYYIGFYKITMGVQRPKGNANVGNRNIKIWIKTETPFLENTTNSTISGINPAPTVSYRPVAYTEYTLPERSAKIDRQNMNALHKNALAHAFWLALVEDYELAW